MAINKKIPLLIGVIAALASTQALSAYNDEGLVQLATMGGHSAPPMAPPSAPPVFTPQMPSSPSGSLWSTPGEEDGNHVQSDSHRLPYTKRDAAAAKLAKDQWDAWTDGMKSSAWSVGTGLVNAADWVGWTAQYGLNFVPGMGGVSAGLDAGRGFAEGFGEAWSEGKPATGALTSGAFKGFVAGGLSLAVGKTKFADGAENLLKTGSETFGRGVADQIFTEGVSESLKEGTKQMVEGGAKVVVTEYAKGVATDNREAIGNTGLNVIGAANDVMSNTGKAIGNAMDGQSLNNYGGSE